MNAIAAFVYEQMQVSSSQEATKDVSCANATLPALWTLYSKLDVERTANLLSPANKLVRRAIILVAFPFSGSKEILSSITTHNHFFVSEGLCLLPFKTLEERDLLLASKEINDGLSIIHWYDPQHKSWLTQNAESEWTGWSTTGSQLLTESPWTPWKSMLDQSDAPYQRWYSGAATNAAFNEIDRHVMDGFGEAAAIIEDQTGNES